ncbi:hypothetical protein SUGI_0820770 [Cryptomeria japonica]|nr:hypothetical protein SUGI_0820770 [Cryptomeria japonica]
MYRRKYVPTSLPFILRSGASPSPLLTLGAPRDATYADNFNFTNVNSMPSVSSSKLVSRMPNIPGSVGLTLPDLKQKLSSVSEIEPRLTLESSRRSVLEPELALQCSVSAMDMELTCSTDVKTTASAFNLERENPFLSKSIQLNSSPSVSLSLSPSLSDPVVSSGFASPASEVTAPRSWLQDATRQKEIINGISGGSVNENKHNFPWCSSDKPVGTLSFDPILPSTKQGVDNLIMQHLPAFFQNLKDLEEGWQSWLMHKKEASWRLNRLEQQLESEKTRKRREKIEEVSAKIRALREEEMTYLDKLESDCREQLSSFQRDAEIKEAKMMEQWTTKHVQLTKFLEQMLYQFPDAHRFFSNDMR